MPKLKNDERKGLLQGHDKKDHEMGRIVLIQTSLTAMSMICRKDDQFEASL